MTLPTSRSTALPPSPMLQAFGIKSASTVRAFTLVEMLVSMSVTAVLLTVLVQMLGATQQTWLLTKSQAESYREARSAFESMARQLSQATLNNYWDYNDPNNPTFYQRQSELHFVSGPASDLLGPAVPAASGHAIFFQAPTGIDSLAAGSPGTGLDQTMNALGYYTTYSTDLPQRPGFMKEASPLHPEKKRFRLMEFRLPTEELGLYKLPTGAIAGQPPALASATSDSSLYSWFRSPVTTRSQPLAENILAVIMQPVTADGTQLTNYHYDTRDFQLHPGGVTSLQAAMRHQLPSSVRLTVVALDETSWSQMEPSEADEVATTLTQRIQGTLFKNPAKYDEDLQSLTAHLTNDLQLQHRIFATTVAIRSAKWHSDRQQATIPTPSP